MSKWIPKTSDYRSVMEGQNPWQQIGSVPLELAPRSHRPLADELWKVLLDKKSRRHQIILGPRRVGKTTVMYQTVGRLIEQKVSPDRLWWLRLDHPLLMDISLGDLAKGIIEASQATTSRPAYVFLDELTYATKWDLWLKTFFDEKWPLRIVGTSSATAAIRQRGTESGVGRWEEQFLAPYLFTEFLALQNRTVECEVQQNLWKTIARMAAHDQTNGGLFPLRRKYVLTGGFPELLLDVKPGPDEASAVLKSQRVLRSDAIEKAIYKDIPQAFAIRDPSKLERLLYILAGQITGVLSPNTVAPEIQLAPQTLESYVAFLERAFMVFTLNNYSPSEDSVQRRGKRLYFVDGAVRNAALLRGIAPMSDTAEMGLLVENMVASHLRALAYQQGVRLYHWRHKTREVDLVFDHPDEPMAFEITVAKSHHVRGLDEFQSRFPRFRGRCFLVSSAPEFRMPTKDVHGAIPLDAMLVAVGLQEEKALSDRIGGSAATPDGQLLLF
ncbi:MAG: ATP-binding protein [Planctomycetaceae bacterium]|nr:ATP-binding protein [Planctomycetaceae bacterium]